MRFRTPLDDVLGAPGRVQLLRMLSRYAEKDFSEREAERTSGLAQASVHRAANALAKQGLLHRRRIGRTNLMRLNRQHPLYSSLKHLFEHEQRLHAELHHTVREHLESASEIDAAVLFGSIQRGVERPDSDIDLLLITAQRDFPAIEQRLDRLSATLRRRFGNPLNPLVKTPRELMALRHKPLYSVLRRGEIIFAKHSLPWRPA